MTDFDPEDGTTRDDLVQRLALMETMIAEGRKTTAHYGWIFVLWGLVYVSAVLWTIYLPLPNLAWPVCIFAGIVIGGIVRTRQRRMHGGDANPRSRSIEIIWKAMGLGVSLYVMAAAFSHHGKDAAYLAAVLFFVGLAHAASAMILRWAAQAAAAAVWWAGGIACFFLTRPEQSIAIFLTASIFGMIFFGLYAMTLERRMLTLQGAQR